jgi:hypothetical protein
MLQSSVESGNLALIGHITSFASQQATSSGSDPPHQAKEDRSVAGRRRLPKTPKDGTEHKFRLALPRRLVKCIWEFSVLECDNAWTFQLKPVNIRPAHTYAFDFVRAGDVSAVRELMRSRQLSIQDREQHANGSWNLLEVRDLQRVLSFGRRLAYHSQMAARNGHLKLCRFLLRETSFSVDNAVLSSALKEVQEHAWRGYQGPDESLLEAFYRLLVDEHNLDIDLMDPPISLPGFWQLTHTNTSFGVVLASQPTPFADLPLAKRFSATIEAAGWPADAFEAMLRHHDPVEVVTQTAEDGKTALHWATAHLGEWLRLEHVNYESLYISRRIESYAKLASELVRTGAEVHALWRATNSPFASIPSLQRYDPFVVLLKGIGLETQIYWDRSGMARAVSVWGQVLVEGGVHLDNCIMNENEFLRTIEWSHVSIPSRGVHGGHLVPARLSIVEESTLAVEILEIQCVTVWKAQATHVPGAWPIAPLIVDTIMWIPGAIDECYGYSWVDTDTIYVRTKPGRNQIGALSTSGGYDELPHDSIIDVVLERWKEQASQDDHGRVARVLGQEMRSRHSGRRASSAPPLQDHRAILGADWANRDVYMPSGWGFTLHKCPLDLHWYKRRRYMDSSDFRRDCMQGRCHEVFISGEHNDAATFEGWFLRNEDYVHVAKRYAQKFCPERMHIVEATLERVTDRARLAMGPKRPGDAGIP